MKGGERTALWLPYFLWSVHGHKQLELVTRDAKDGDAEALPA